ncbi:sigma-70 family RNA polymerase sigma factor [Lujinxingia litoralis]|nr:sigma-70 family RNA polymerase sigma factor [Lujinxingia litoralis]
MAAPALSMPLSPSAAPPVPALHPLARKRARSSRDTDLHADSLTTYMNQIRRIELLPNEIQDRLVRAFLEEGDEEAAKTLVWANLRLVVKVATDLHRPGHDLLDLIQEGNLGLTEALTRFDPNRGTSFVGYAHFWIRALIFNYLLNHTYPVRMGSSRDSRKLFFNLRKARRQLRAQGLEPTAENVAQYLEVDVDEVERVATLTSGGFSRLDAPLGGESDTTGRDMLPSEESSPEEQAHEHLFHEHLQALAEEFVNTIDDSRRRTIWYERMIAVHPRQLDELGEEFGVSKERIRQLEMDMRKKFRVYLETRHAPTLEAYLAS